MLGRRSIPLSLAAEWEGMGCRIWAYFGDLAASPTTKLIAVLLWKSARLVPDSNAFVGLSLSNHINF